MTYIFRSDKNQNLAFAYFVAVFFVGLLLLVAPKAFAESAISANVVGVHDGDTITVLTTEKKTLKIRLAEIDAPESGQPYGSKAKQVLSDLVFGKNIKIEVQDIDRYGRTVGRIFYNRVDINAEIVRSGAAWVYRQYSKDKILLSLEQEAKESKRGLWSLPEFEQVPPWEWRKKSNREARKKTSCFGDCRDLAETGNVEAQFSHATYLRVTGDLSVSNFGEAFEWFLRAAEQGHGEAQKNLGDFYLLGLGGVSKDYSTALEWYIKAAKSGYSPANFSAGFMYLRGYGVPKDKKRALGWFQNGADQGGRQLAVKEITQEVSLDLGSSTALSLFNDLNIILSADESYSIIGMDWLKNNYADRQKYGLARDTECPSLHSEPLNINIAHVSYDCRRSISESECYSNIYIYGTTSYKAPHTVRITCKQDYKSGSISAENSILMQGGRGNLLHSMHKPKGENGLPLNTLCEVIDNRTCLTKK